MKLRGTSGHRPISFRQEWILTSHVLFASLLLLLPVRAISGELQTIQQPYCWNEYEDVASRTFVAPVVVRALCTVIYSRGAIAQFNATFQVSKVLKGNRETASYLQENPQVHLNFGLTDTWIMFPATSTEVQQEGLLRGQTCSVPKVDLQKEYLLFLQPHNSHGTGDVANEVSDDVPVESATVWTVYAAPEVFNQTNLAAVQKVLRRGKPPTVLKLRPTTTVRAGQEVILRCRVKGFPHPKILWFKDGHSLDHQRRKGVVIQPQTHSRQRLSRLRIKKAKLGDSGRYRCLAVNVVGSAQSEVTVTVLLGAEKTPPKLNMSTTDHWTIKGILCTERTFCLNNGICTFYPRIDARACNCTSGFSGPRCEKTDPLTSSVVYPVMLGPSHLEIFLYVTNSLLIILVIILLLYASGVYRTLNQYVPALSRAGSMAFNRQMSINSRNTDQVTSIAFEVKQSLSARPSAVPVIQQEDENNQNTSLISSDNYRNGGVTENGRRTSTVQFPSAADVVKQPANGKGWNKSNLLKKFHYPTGPVINPEETKTLVSQMPAQLEGVIINGNHSCAVPGSIAAESQL